MHGNITYGKACHLQLKKKKKDVYYLDKILKRNFQLIKDHYCIVLHFHFLLSKKEQLSWRLSKLLSVMNPIDYQRMQNRNLRILQNPITTSFAF